MSQLQFHVRLDDPPDFQADAVLGDSIFGVLMDVRDVRRLRAGIMDAARVLAPEQSRRSILILEEPGISRERLNGVFSEIHDLFHPEIIERLAFVIRRESHAEQVFGRLTDEEGAVVEMVVEHTRLHSLRPGRRPSEAFGDILKVLMVHWIRKSGPLALKDICVQTGISYPTLAAALDRLEPWLLRHSDRRVELRSFPRDEWSKLIANSTKARISQGYTDRSGKPRSMEALLERLGEVDRYCVAVGGIVAARHYVPGLDLVGTPRLDLIFHRDNHRPAAAPIAKVYSAIVRELDAALVPAEHGEPCRVVLHSLFRNEPFFSKSSSGFRADEVECLLDLHDARLESQALEFLDRISPKPES